MNQKIRDLAEQKLQEVDKQKTDLLVERASMQSKIRMLELQVQELTRKNEEQERMHLQSFR